MMKKEMAKMTKSEMVHPKSGNDERTKKNQLMDPCITRVTKRNVSQRRVRRGQNQN